MNLWRGVDDRWRGMARRKGYQLRFPVWWVAALGTLTCGFIGATLAGFPAAVLGAPAGFVTPWVAIRAAPDRRAAQLDSQVPEFLDSVARSLRAGRSLVSALASATAETSEPLAAELRALGSRVEAGVPLREVIARSAAVSTSAPLCTALAAIAIANDAGGAPAMVFDALAASLRSRAAAARELRGLTTPVRVSAGLIALAPPAMFVAIALVDRTLAQRAFATAVGAIAASAGVVLDLVGLAWIRRLTRFEP